MTFTRTMPLVGVALLVSIANVAASVLYMVVYGHVIDPGHEAQYYNDHIQAAGPYCSTIAGVPLMYLAAWWVTGWWQRTLGVLPAFIVWLAYTLIDLAVLLLVGLSLWVGLLFTISFGTKLAAAYWGAKHRLVPSKKFAVGP
jgi:hypothetical protein